MAKVNVFATNLIDLIFLSEREGELIYLRSIKRLTGEMSQVHLFSMQLTAFNIGWHFEHRKTHGSHAINDAVSSLITLGKELSESEWNYAFNIGYRHHN